MHSSTYRKQARNGSLHLHYSSQQLVGDGHWNHQQLKLGAELKKKTQNQDETL